jgi:hypothetical protein
LKSAIEIGKNNAPGGYLNPKERARRTLSIRHGLKDPRERSTKTGNMVVKGPAGGYSNAEIHSNQTPSPFYKKQGTVAKVHMMIK